MKLYQTAVFAEKAAVFSFFRAIRLHAYRTGARLPAKCACKYYTDMVQ